MVCNICRFDSGGNKSVLARHMAEKHDGKGAQAFFAKTEVKGLGVFGESGSAGLGQNDFGGAESSKRVTKRATPRSKTGRVSRKKASTDEP